MIEVSDFSNLLLMAQALGFKLIVAICALIVVLGAIHRFEKKHGVDTYGWISDASDMAKAVYFGLQFLGVCLLFGFIFT